MNPSVYTVSPSDELALVKKYPPFPFVNIKQLADTVERRQTEIDTLHKTNYISFGEVTPMKFQEIQKYRENAGLHLRFTYFPDIATLIIKIPTKEHDQSHAQLFQCIDRRLTLMGVDYREFAAMATTTTKSSEQRVGQRPSSKEGDSTAINKKIRKAGEDWPVFVIESGVSESLARLRADARWWIENSKGQVLMVLIIKIERNNRSARIIKYIPQAVPALRSTRSNQAGLLRMEPSEVADIQINQSLSPSVVTGAPLTLEFEKLVGRPKITPQESDVIFTASDLDSIVEEIW